MAKKIAVIPGDGIGPEVIAQGMRVLERLDLDLEFVHFGWNADEFLRTGVSMPPAAMDDIRQNYDAVYLGAFGDPRIPDMKHAADILLGLRFQLDLYVNYRPVKLLNDRLSPLKDKKKIDFVIFRENTEGAYVGMGGNFKKGTPEEIAVQEDVSTRRGVERIIRYAFEFAKRSGRKSVCMSDKSNVMRFGGDLWMRTFEEVAGEYPSIEHFHMFVDALTMQMVRAPDRRHRHRPRRGAAGRAGRCRVGKHQSRQSLHVRADPRQRAEVRRKRCRQSDRRYAHRRDDARIPRSRRRGETDRGRSDRRSRRRRNNERPRRLVGNESSGRGGVEKGADVVASCRLPVTGNGQPGTKEKT